MKRRGLWSRVALVGALAGLFGGLIAVAPAVAAEPTAVLQITKTVNRDTLAPNDTLAYTIAVDCLTDDCVNAQLVDELPAEFDALTLNPTVVVTGGASDYSWGGPNGRTLTVDFTKATPSGPGIPSGEGYSVQVSLTVPAGLSPDWEYNGDAVTNTASISALTADTAQASAIATVVVPYTVATTCTASWAPSSAQYDIGATSTLTLVTRNTSNARAESLTLLVPTDPTAATNLFDSVDLAGFGAVAFPGGSDLIRIDAYVDGAWIDGTPAAEPTLAAGVVLGDVTGLRITFSSSAGVALTANGSAGSIELLLAQRASTRTSETSLVLGDTITALVQGTVSIPGHGTQSASATASYEILPLTAAVSETLSFATSRIPAGTGTTATITGRNESNGILTSFTVGQPAGTSLFAETVTFGGFGSVVWPDGAESAVVTWFVDSGDAPGIVELETGDGLPATPALEPGQRITGFAIAFSGEIPVGATAAIPFLIDVAADAVDAVPGILELVDTARVDGVNDAGDAAPATPSATLTVLYPQIAVDLVKTITPTAAVPAGGRSIVQLRARTDSDSGYVSPTSIQITDVIDLDAGPGYWDAFTAVAVAPTQVPAGSTLVIATTTDGVLWTDVETVVAGSVGTIYQGLLDDAADLVGIRFTYLDEDGFAQGTTVQGNVAFVARATLRGTATPTSTEDAPVEYANSASVLAIGDVLLEGGGAVTATATASAVGTIKTLPAGSGGLLFEKEWLVVSGSTTVSSQSGQERTARLWWGTEISGYETAIITDPADPDAPVSETVFQAFDLTRIDPITTDDDPLMVYDRIVDIELRIDGLWQSIMDDACPSADACSGGFDGYTLSSDQRRDTTGVRITIAEYEGARLSDPLAPPVGSGVASGPDSRPIDLVFAVRNSVRDASALADPANPWVTADRVFNDTDPGSILNTGRLQLDAISGSDSSAILLIDPIPGLTLTKEARNSAGAVITQDIAIPHPGDVAASAYPTVRFTMSATNSSAARAWFLRVTDQMPCTTETVTACVHATDGEIGGWTINPYEDLTWNPATSPFDAFTIRDIGYTLSSGSGIDPDSSTVILWMADGTTDTVTLAEAAGLSASALADVVGVSALFASSSIDDGGTIASGATATLTLETRMRQFLRSSPSTLVGPGTVTNSAFAQIWDGVLDDTAAYTSKSASVTLVSASLDIVVGKTFSPTSVLEATRTNDVTVTLTGNQGTSTASTREVVIQDVRPEFWNAFELRSLTSASRPSGANQMRVDVQLNGGSDWVLGTPVATSPALPAGITASQVTGLRVVAWKTDNSLFSVTAPAAGWNTTIRFVVRLRDDYRDTGDEIPFPGTVTNTVTGTSDHAALGTETASFDRSITLNPGTFRVDVEKRTPVKTTPAGETVDFSLIVTNTGTGFLDNPVVVDQLPVDAGLAAGGPLLFDPTSELTYSTSVGGILPTTGVTFGYDDDTRRLTFSWPEGSRLAPGERYVIVIPLQVAPGLPASYGDVVNRMTFSSDRVLAACTNTSGNGEGVAYVGTQGCTTSNDVTTIAASAISSFKGVKGNVDESGVSSTGAVNVNNPATACVADSQGFYRNPCAAHSVIGGTDLWKLQFTNGGNVPATSATVVDVLPRSGDVYLGTGASRGSTYRPTFAGGLTLATDALSAGTTMTWQVTTAANPCPNFTTDALCSTATWIDSDDYAGSLAAVTAVRVTFVFPDDELPPAATLAVTYRTVNAPTTVSGDGRAPVTVPLGTPRAWNSFGVFATFGGGFTDRRVEPVRAGVQLASGPIEISKAITGTTAAYAPTAFEASVHCTIEGVPVVLPASGAVTLAATNATPYTTRIDGIPVGAACEIVETTTGASGVSYSPEAPLGAPGAGLTVAQAASASAEVPEAQVATITNDYGTTTLAISKVVTTTATVGEVGPFDVELSCSVDTGAETLEVPLSAEDSAFTLIAGGEPRIIENLPVTARCDLRETDSDGAARIAVAVDGGVGASVVEGEPAAIWLGTDERYDVVITNDYDGGRLAVTKQVTGDAADYGSGPFTVEVTCGYDGQTLFDGELSLEAGETETLSPIFPVGTECAFEETDAGGATVAAPAGSVSIVGPTGDDTVGLVTAVLTNRFDAGALRIEKQREGSVERYGAGPFEAQVTCTWDKPGSPDLTIPLPDSGLVELTSENEYTGTVTGLIAGADCVVAESRSGGATDHSITEVAAIPADGETLVTITNRFDVGSLVIDKVRIGEGAAEFGDGPFQVALECAYESDGTWVDIDLGDEASLELSVDNDYRVQVDDLLVGARCTVVETDAGLAVESATTPEDGVVVIPVAEDGPASVTVTNTFRVGELEVEKTASEPLVQGGDSLDYTVVVANVGEVDAGGVAVVDELDPTLALTGVTADDWICNLSGEDEAGYGGTLRCELPGVLGIGATAPPITYTVQVHPEIAQDVLVNEAIASSTTVVVSGDADEASTAVTWLDVTASSICVQDAPWLDYEVDARNLDVAGRTLTVDWRDADGVVIHTDEIAIEGEGVVTGRLLWPGAAVDSAADGVAWPGWRPALPGETPDWENLVLDPEAFGYGLRSGASVEFSINVATTLAVIYPPATEDRAETPDDAEAELWMTKTASDSEIAAGETFHYVMAIGNDGRGAVSGLTLIDDVPEALRVLSVETAEPAGGSDPDWESCEISERGPTGFGGIITCVLDRDLGHGQVAPDVILEVQLSGNATRGAIVNTARVTAFEVGADGPDETDLATLALEDSAMITTAGRLALTGASPSLAALLGMLLLSAGALLTVRRPWRSADRAA